MKKTLFVCFLSLLFSLSACVESDETTNSSSFTESSTTHSSSQTSTTKSSVVESTQTETDWIQEKITTMTLAEKVGQLFLARFPGEQALNDSQTYNLGGFILFGTDVVNENKDSLIEKIQNLQAKQKIHLFFASDEEGGTVTRISMNPNLVEARFLSPQAIYQEQGWEGIAKETKGKAAILADLGFQFGMFPVADVATNPQAFIYERTIGLDVTGTSTFVETVVKSLKETGVASTLKHFPGYGDNLDSHVEIVTDTRSLTELEEDALPPFQSGIEAGADSILVSHNIITSLDATQPASISPTVIQFLREELQFEGVIMTDDLDMAGMTDFTSQEAAALSALKAGNDLVLSSHYASQIPVIIQAVEQNDYPEIDLNQAVYRVLKLKAELGVLKE